MDRYDDDERLVGVRAGKCNVVMQVLGSEMLGLHCLGEGQLWTLGYVAEAVSDSFKVSVRTNSFCRCNCEFSLHIFFNLLSSYHCSTYSILINSRR